MKNAKPTAMAPALGIKNPRQLRVLKALLQGPRSRTEVDTISGASNGPEVIAQLRHHGLSIECELVPGVDRDGEKVRFGVYRLTDKDRELLQGGEEPLLSQQDCGGR